MAQGEAGEGDGGAGNASRGTDAGEGEGGKGEGRTIHRGSERTPGRYRGEAGLWPGTPLQLHGAPMNLLSSWLLLSSAALAGDRDHDGVKGREDLCPEEAETRNGYRDGDGCPDELGDVTVTVLDLEGSVVRGARVRLAFLLFGRGWA